ncbi:MAG: DUF2157 domain-containing protein [Methylacidiphilales bacterium]|nr:DUF2157 domain-containing protein [Candidatus Methylacidiphilales bacterium]
MFDRIFIRRLERELPRWVDQGWLPAEGRSAILNDLVLRAQARQTPTLVFGGLGALLLAVGVVLFFAANWQAIPRWAKLVLILGMVWGSYGAAFALTRSGLRRFAEALVLLGALLFGAAIMLIGQTYHLPADPAGGVLLWTLGAFLAAYLWPSGLAAILGLALACLWAGLVVAESLPELFWPFLLVWAVPIPLILRHGWRAARHVALIAFFYWLLLSFVTIGELFDPDADDLLRFGAALGAFFVALGALIAADARFGEEGHIIGHYGLVIFALMMFPGVMPRLYAQVDLGDPTAAGFRLRLRHGGGGGCPLHHLDPPMDGGPDPVLCVGGAGAIWWSPCCRRSSRACPCWRSTSGCSASGSAWWRSVTARTTGLPSIWGSSRSRSVWSASTSPGSGRCSTGPSFSSRAARSCSAPAGFWSGSGGA